MTAAADGMPALLAAALVHLHDVLRVGRRLELTDGDLVRLHERCTTPEARIALAHTYCLALDASSDALSRRPEEA